jgi:hypothetical protein
MIVLFSSFVVVIVILTRRDYQFRSSARVYLVTGVGVHLTGKMCKLVVPSDFIRGKNENLDKLAERLFPESSLHSPSIRTGVPFACHQSW